MKDGRDSKTIKITFYSYFCLICNFKSSSITYNTFHLSMDVNSKTTTRTKIVLSTVFNEVDVYKDCGYLVLCNFLPDHLTPPGRLYVTEERFV